MRSVLTAVCAALLLGVLAQPAAAAPETTITSGAGPFYVMNWFGMSPITFTSDDPSATFECQRNNEGWQPCTSPWSMPYEIDPDTWLPRGTHTFWVRAISGGEPDDTPASVQATWDDNGPRATLMIDGEQLPYGDPFVMVHHDFGWVNDPVQVLHIVAEDDETPISHFECRVMAEGGFTIPWTTCASPFIFDGRDGDGNLLPDNDVGNVVISGRAYDSAGNQSNLVEINYKLDTKAPTSTIDSGPSGRTTNKDASFAFSSDEALVSYECKLNDGEWGPCTSGDTQFSGLDDGDYTFHLRTTDKAGNTHETSQTFTVDTTAPTITFTSGPDGPTALTEPTFAWTVNDDDPAVTVTCSVDGGGYAPCASPYQTDALADGPHSISVRAVDSVGNSHTETRNFSVHSTPPGISIDTKPAAVITTDQTTVTFSSPDTDSTFQCALDGAGWAACTSPLNLTDLDDGDHTLLVRAVNPAEVPSSTETITFKVDTTPPAISSHTGPTGPINTDQATFTFVSDDPDATWECRFTGDADWAACTSPQTRDNLDEGTYRFQARPTDPHGNTGDPIVFDFEVDLVPPPAPTVSGPSVTNHGSTPEFHFTSPEPDVSFECSLDRSPWDPCGPVYTPPPLPPGEHLLEVRSQDPAGNRGPVVEFPIVVSAPSSAGPAGQSDPGGSAPDGASPQNRWLEVKLVAPKRPLARGDKLTCEVDRYGISDRAPLRFIWQRNHQDLPDVSGEEKSTYTLTGADRNQQLRCVVQAQDEATLLTSVSDDLLVGPLAQVRAAAKPRVLKLIAPRRVRSGVLRPSVAARKIRWRQSAPARATLTVQRCASGRRGCARPRKISKAAQNATRSSRLQVKTARRLKLRSLRAGRYRIVVKVAASRASRVIRVFPKRR